MPEREQQPSLAEVLDRLLELGANDNPASFRRLAEAAQLDPSRDFIGASLRNIDMRDEDLRGFDFSNADLAGTDFRRANVQGVRFRNANLEGVIGLRDASLSATGTASRSALRSPRQLLQYRVFIGTPGGLQEEREAFRRVIAAFNEHHGEPNGIVFAPIGWEDTLGGVGRPQELINEDLRLCEFAVFVFHDRLGYPAGRSTGGAEEEWLLAQELYEKKVIRNICLFFKQVDPAKLADPGPQLQRVLDFRAEIENGRKHLFQTYINVQVFSASLEKHLANWMRQLVGAAHDELATLSQPATDDRPEPAPEDERSFSDWLQQSMQLSSVDGPDSYPDMTGALFCAERALELARTDVEWADAETARAMALGYLGRIEEAIAIYDDLFDRFGNASEVALREKVARALLSKGARFNEVGRIEEAIMVYDDVLYRFGNAREPVLREQVARALFSKGARLEELGRIVEAITVYGDLVDRFGTASEIALQILVQRATELRTRLSSEFKKSVARGAD